MSLNTPTFRNRPGRSPARTIPDSRPATNIPRPRVFPANTNRPPPAPVPVKGQMSVRTPKGLAAAAVQAVITGYVRPGGPPTGDSYYSITVDADPLYDRITPWAQNLLGGTVGPDPLWRSNPNGSVRRLRTTSANFWVYTTVRYQDRPGTASDWAHENPYLWPGNTSSPPVGDPQLVPLPEPAVAPAQLPRFRPREEPAPRLVRPSISPGVGFDVFPNRPPKPVRVAARKPPRNVEEGKAVNKAAAAVAYVAAVLDSVSEVKDVLAIFWDHLGPRPGETFYGTMQRYMENPDLWAGVDWDAMVRDMIMNEIEDQVVGRIHGLKKRLSTEWGTPTYGSVFVERS